MKKTQVVMISAVVAGLAVAQGSARPTPERTASRDAGVVSSKSDAGITDAPRPALPSGDVERLKKDVAELRAKVTELEAKAAKAETLAGDLDKLQRRFEELKTRVDEDQERREAEEREVARKKANAAQATSTLQTTLQQLSLGNTSNVDAWLRSAEGQLNGNAQKLVGLARQALAQQDLNTARQLLVLALSEANTP